MVLYIYKKWDKEVSKKLFNIEKYFYIYLNKKIFINEQSYENFEFLVLNYLKGSKKYNEKYNKYGFKILHNKKDLLDYSKEQLKIFLLDKQDFIREEYEEFKNRGDICKIQKLNFDINKSSNFVEYINRYNSLGCKYYSVKCLRLFNYYKNFIP